MAARSRSVPPFPENTKRTEEVADWLELKALFSHDRNGSAADIDRELVRLNVDDRESLLGNVFLEIDRRQQATGRAYPFTRADTSIEISTGAKKFAAYFFCLALSYYGWKPRRNAPCNPWLLFEAISGHCAASFVNGDVVIFGTSARSGRQAKNVFATKVKELASKLGEGEGFRKQRTFSTKDSKVDLVAWRGFPDKRASQMILFGQCAGGENWRGDKLSSLNPDAFWDQWMKKGKVSALFESVFIPHRLFEDDEWELRARRARLLFDRCRVVHCADARIPRKLKTELLKCCRSEWRLPV
jgi:hypothetical protein